MSWFRGSVLVLGVVLSGCKDERLLAREKELTQAEQQLSELNALHKRLLAEKQSLEQKARDAEAGAQSARAEHQQALAAAAWLSPKVGESLPLDDDMRQARLLFELKQALARSDSDSVNTLITRATRPEWECLALEKEVTCGHCTPPEDACKDVPETLQLDPRWTCQAVPRDGAPPDVFCTAPVQYLPSSPRDKEGATHNVDLIRVAFAHEDELYVSDLDPDPDAFISANPYRRDSCYRDNQGYGCMHECEVASYTGPCACHGEHAERDDEELDRMCDCMTDSPLYMGAPSIEETSTLLRSPAPGVFIVRVEHVEDDRSGSLTRTWRLLVLADTARIELTETGAPSGSIEPLRKLELLAELEEWPSASSPQSEAASPAGGPESGVPARVAWLKLPEGRLEAVLGFKEKALIGFAFDPAPPETAKVITPLTPDMFCPLIANEPSRFPPDFPAWCGENWRPAPPGAPAGKRDAGGTP